MIFCCCCCRCCLDPVFFFNLKHWWRRRWTRLCLQFLQFQPVPFSAADIILLKIYLQSPQIHFLQFILSLQSPSSHCIQFHL
uniref:Candidate secreted effector n=1 Tax=Meloidogyne incognita TaxID=6306 RepID=A0A914KHV8_MELIC